MTQMQWQPIETAPRDGTIILLCNGGWVTAGYWHLAAKATSGDTDIGPDFPWLVLDESNVVNGFRENSPTHWMPLPPPPETARSEP